MKLAEINALIEQMTLEIGARQDMLSALHRMRGTLTKPKRLKGKAAQQHRPTIKEGTL